MNITTFTKKFHDIEDRLDTFSFKDKHGEHYWDAVRFYVFNYTYVSITGNKFIYGQQPQDANTLKRIIKKSIAFLAQKLFILNSKYSRKYILFINCSRAISKEQSFDSLLKPLESFLPYLPLNIETYPTRKLYKLLSSTSFLLTNKVVKQKDLNQTEIIKFNKELNRVFGLSIDISDVVIENTSIYLAQLAFYRNLFSKTKIRHVFMVQNGIQKGLLKAAKECGVVVNEIQHGYMGYTHPAYSYSANILNNKNISSPTRLLSFSNFWKKGYYSPVKEFIVIGKQQKKQIQQHNKCPTKVLIISASLYHENLSSLLKIIAIKQQSVEFKYKLHPNQFLEKNDIISEFSMFPNITVISNEKTFEECLVTCLHVLCIQSTGVYEALQTGSFVYCYKRQDYNYHDNVVNSPGFALIDDADEFIQLVNFNNKAPSFTPTEFFDTYRPERIKHLV